LVDKKTQKEQQKTKRKALHNLSELDLTLVTTSAYFKPEPEKKYVIKINPEDKVEIFLFGLNSK
jgi:hypothetical protein